MGRARFFSLSKKSVPVAISLIPHFIPKKQLETTKKRHRNTEKLNKNTLFALSSFFFFLHYLLKEGMKTQVNLISRAQRPTVHCTLHTVPKESQTASGSKASCLHWALLIRGSTIVLIEELASRVGINSS